MGTFPYRLEPRTAREYKYGGKHGSVVFVGGYTVEDVHRNTFYLQADTRLAIDGKPLG